MLSAASFGYDGSMVNGLQTLPQWTDYFHHPTASRLGAINAVWPVGQFLGIFPTTWISDRYGRKTPMYIGFFVLALATALQGGAQNLAMFIVARFLFGFGTSFMYQPAPILITELAYPTHRGKVTALYNTNNVSLAIPVKNSSISNIDLVARINICCVVNIWYSHHPKHLGVEDTFHTSGFFYGSADTPHSPSP